VFNGVQTDVMCVDISGEFKPGQHSQYSDQAMDWKCRGLNPGRAMRFISFPDTFCKMTNKCTLSHKLSHSYTL